MIKKIFTLLSFISTTALAVEGGFQLKDKQWDDVVHLKTSVGSCSGALLNQQWVLTAAHCVDKKDNQEISVYSGLKADNFLSKAHLAFIDPRYSSQYSNYDVALLKLTEKAKSPNNLKLSGSKIYSYLLHGKYPPRKVLVAGFGLDEKNQLGTRKGAFEIELGIYPGESYIGSFFTLKSIGNTRPGDSGGPVFVLTPEGHQLFGVVSGENNYTIKDDDGDIKEHAIRNAPLASSLCLLDVKTQSAIQFDSSYCEKIKQAESKLSKPPQSKEDHLWQAALAVASPLREVESIRNEVFRKVAVSFSELDSLMARKYIKDHLDIIFTERETKKIIRDALNRYENRSRDNKYTMGAVSKMEEAVYSSEVKISMIKSKDNSLVEQCGNQTCLEVWRTSVSSPGYQKQFKDQELNWDFLTSVNVTNDPFNLSSLVCLCNSNQGNGNLNKIFEKLNAIGLSTELLGTTELDNGFEIKGKSSKSNIRMICEKFHYKGQNYKTIHVSLSLDVNVAVSDLNSLTSNLNRAASKNSLTKDYMSPGSFSFTDPKNNNNFSQENRLMSVNIDEVQGTQSVMITEIFQCQ